MIQFLKKLFEKKKLYNIFISLQDGAELENYWETPLYKEDNGYRFIKYLTPSTVKNGLIFYSDSGVKFQVSRVIDASSLNAKRI